MKKVLTLLVLALLLLPALVFAQFDPQLKEDIVNSGYLHRPLPLDYSK